MISLYDAAGEKVEADLSGRSLPPGTVFIDLCQASTEEIAFVERATNLQLPTPHRLSEVEASSRLAMQRDTLVVTTPVIYRGPDSTVNTSPVGFVLSRELLITIRFVELKAFADFLAQKSFGVKEPARAATQIFLGLLEVAVDRMADAMEQVGADLDTMSQRIFDPEREGKVSMRPSRVERRLTRALKTIGRTGELTSHGRDSLLGLGRLVGYVGTHAVEWFPPPDKARLETLKQDITSLNDYETRLTDKVQFLLDSTLGFISIEQNRTFKILTVVSVIGIPPTFVVGLYGMNFKNMPEYDWAYGYQWGLLLIITSIIIPGVWLKWRGWF